LEWGAVTELRHLSLCHCACVCVCVCPLHATQGLATSRTVLRHPAGAPHVMDCYLCGREFDTRILNNHEDECIKHWRKWNNSLPLDQRQQEPERPEFKFHKGHLYVLTYVCVARLDHRGFCTYFCRHTGCPRRNVSDFGRVFLMLKYTDITQNTYIQSSTVTELMAREV